jgi:hypothetical protein
MHGTSCSTRRPPLDTPLGGTQPSNKQVHAARPIQTGIALLPQLLVMAVGHMRGITHPAGGNMQ